MIEQLIAWDHQLFRLINGWNSPLADKVMYLISEPWPWIPAYLILLVVSFRKMDWKRWGLLLVGLALLISFTDGVSARLFKPGFERKRPCHVEAELGFPVHVMPGDCGGQYGFVSSHAANFFGLATFWGLFFRKKHWWGIFMGVAVLVAYSRVYLGVHFPADVLGGALLGMLGGWWTFTFQQWLGNRLLSTPNQ